MLLGRGGSGGFGGGGRAFGGRPSGGRPSGGGRPRPPTSRPRVPSGSSHTYVNHVTTRVTNVRVYGGRSYPYRGGGWGYGYYGPHPYFDSWYGYPMYYGYPGHWSGWDWPVGIVAILLVLGLLVGAVAMFRDV